MDLAFSDIGTSVRNNSKGRLSSPLKRRNVPFASHLAREGIFTAVVLNCDGSTLYRLAENRSTFDCIYRGCFAAIVRSSDKSASVLPTRVEPKSFERYVVELSRHMTIQDVALLLVVGWELVKEIQRRNLIKRFSRSKLKRLKHIANDEISIGKDHRYLTVVLDLLTGAVIFVGEGKGAEALGPFWQRLKCSRTKIEAVAIDMSLTYISAVFSNLPNATNVFDHFHIIKLFNEKLSDLRRNIYQKLNKTGQKVLKGTRWSLLKNSHRLRSKYQEKQRLDKALRINTALTTAYYLKEDLGQLWS